MSLLHLLLPLSHVQQVAQRVELGVELATPSLLPVNVRGQQWKWVARVSGLKGRMSGAEVREKLCGGATDLIFFLPGESTDTQRVRDE